MAVGDYVNNSEMPLMGPAVGIVWLAQGWDYIFRATANTGSMVQTAFATIKAKGYKTVGFFNINEEYGNNSIKDFDALLAKDPIVTVTAREKYKDGDTDFTAQCVKIRQANPDAVYLVGWSNDCGQIIKQIRAAGYDKPIYGDNAFTGASVRQVAGAAAENCFFAAAYIMPDSVAEIDTNPSFAGKTINKYLKAFNKKYNALPNEDNAYRAYDGIMILAEAIGNAKSLKGSAIRDAIHAISNHEGNIGIMNYARFPNGECVDVVATWEIKGGKVIPSK
jgi:branched-chain amino acid transport system substrate-binding protein